jgi:hypothetical protein
MKLKTETKMEDGVFIDRISARIRAKITEGSGALKDNRVQAEIYHLLTQAEYNKLLPMLQEPERLMPEFVKMLITALPYSPAYFDQLGASLKPLADIAAILNPDVLNEFVQFWGGHCYLRDPRLTIIDFKKTLWQQTFKPSDDAQNEE